MAADETPETVVVTTAVRLVAPFACTFGLYTTFHGGVVVAAVVLTVAFAFGTRQTARWLDRPVLAVGAALGVVAFAALGAGPAFFGGTFLELTAFPGEKGALYAIEAIEVGIGVTVTTTVVVLFFAIAGGFEGDRE